MNTFRIRTCALALSAAVALTACSDIFGSRTRNVADAEVNVPRSVLGIGETIQLTVTVRDRTGAVLPDYPVVWSSTDRSILTVDGAGRVQARGRGVTWVSTSVGERVVGASLQVYDAKVKVDDSLGISLADSSRMLAAATYDGDRHIVGQSARFTVQDTGVVALRDCGGACTGNSRGTRVFVTPLNVGTARVVVEWLGASDTAIVRVTP